MGRSQRLRSAKFQPKVLETYETGRMGRLFEIPYAKENHVVFENRKSTTIIVGTGIDEKSSHSSRFPTSTPERADIPSEPERPEPEQPEPEQPEPEQPNAGLPPGLFEILLDDDEPRLFCHRISPTETWLCNRREDLKYGALAPVPESENNSS